MRNTLEILQNVIFAHASFDIVSICLFGITFAMILEDASYKSHWNILVIATNEKWRHIWICPVRNCLICFTSIMWVHFCHKTDKFWFSKSLTYFSACWSKKGCQVWICSVKQCLIWFKLRFLSSILSIFWEIQILNFIEIV